MQLARLRIVLVAMLALIVAAWLVSVPGAAFAGGFWPVRRALIYLTGLLALGTMSAGVILAARPVQIEGLLGGLDKFYRLHRWFGIAAASFAVLHWLLEIVPRSMVRQGWLSRPQGRPSGGAVQAGPDWLRALHGIGADIGEWGLYLLLVLVALALWRRFPYRYFLKTHRLMAPLYLALVFHGVVLMDAAYWSAPIGALMVLLMAGGSAAAITSLFGRIGQARRAVGRIEAITKYDENMVLDVVIQLETAWTGHHAGQFAFVDFGGVEGAHPFTISSSWHRDGRLSFTIKGLGDYTRALPDQLFVGQSVTVEGPYGRFDFGGGRKHQIWIGGGIGITPFIARLQALADDGQGASVDLIYSTNAPSEPFIGNIRRLAERTGVRFHLIVPPRDGILTFERLTTMVPAWKDADVWFCGPLGFGRAIREALTARGFPAANFHQELFDMR